MKVSDEKKLQIIKKVSRHLYGDPSHREQRAKQIVEAVLLQLDDDSKDDDDSVVDFKTQPYEDRWREIRNKLDQKYSSYLYHQEQELWDDYVDACQKEDECQLPGCHALADAEAYCPQHRD